MGVKKEVVAVVGTYTDGDGNEKKRYLRIGSIMKTRNGDMLKLDSVPLGWNGWAYLNDPKEKDGGDGGRPQRERPARSPNAGSSRSPMAPAPTPGGSFDDDDIPF